MNRSIRSKFVVAGLLLFSLPIAASPRQPNVSNKTQEKKSKLSKILPCRVKPNLDFMNAANGEYAHEHFLSAAWFARAVQLPNETRKQHWQALEQQPISIKDFYAGPFGLHATLLEFDRKVLLLYRGTQDPLDYILNAAFFTSPGWVHRLPGWVHKGFLINFGLSWRQIRGTLKQMADQGKTVTFAAHSLGGVLSQYAAWRAEEDGIAVDRIYAFQAPNAGDETFRDAFENRFAGRSANLIFGEDLTPHIPPTRESFREFADATMRVLSGPLSAIVRQAKYAALAERFRLSDSGHVEAVATEDIVRSEKAFWSSYKQKTGGKAFPKGLGPESAFIADHNVERVVCTLAKATADNY